MGSGLCCLYWKRLELLSRERLDEGEPAAGATIAELNGAADLGEEGVVLADANVEAGLDRCSTLPHDDRAAGYDLTAERLDAQSLGI